jgi:hypothetical protein
VSYLNHPFLQKSILFYHPYTRMEIFLVHAMKAFASVACDGSFAHARAAPITLLSEYWVGSRASMVAVVKSRIYYPSQK